MHLEKLPNPKQVIIERNKQNAERLDNMTEAEYRQRRLGSRAIAETMTPIQEVYLKVRSYVEGQLELDDMRERAHQDSSYNLHDDPRFIELRNSATSYNHALKNVMNNGQITFNELLSKIQDAYRLTTFGNKDAQPVDIGVFNELIRSTITGMQQEIAVEAMLYNIDPTYDVEVSDADSTIAEDLAGKDIQFTFTYGGVTYHISLDVKSSQFAVDKKNEKTAEWEHRTGKHSSVGTNLSICLTSGIPHEEFKGLLVADRETILNHTPDFTDKIIAEIEYAKSTQIAS